MSDLGYADSEVVVVGAQSLEHPGGNCVRIEEQAQKKVFGPHVVVAQFHRLPDGVMNRRLRPRGIGAFRPLIRSLA